MLTLLCLTLRCAAVCCCTAEYTAAEVSQGLHTNSLKFAYESKSERGWANAAAAKDLDAAKAVHVKAGTA